MVVVRTIHITIMYKPCKWLFTSDITNVIDKPASLSGLNTTVFYLLHYRFRYIWKITASNLTHYSAPFSSHHPHRLCLWWVRRLSFCVTHSHFYSASCRCSPRVYALLIFFFLVLVVLFLPLFLLSFPFSFASSHSTCIWISAPVALATVALASPSCKTSFSKVLKSFSTLVIHILNKPTMVLSGCKGTDKTLQSFKDKPSKWQRLRQSCH